MEEEAKIKNFIFPTHISSHIYMPHHVCLPKLGGNKEIIQKRIFNKA
jgi:hypothetical protein